MYNVTLQYNGRHYPIHDDKIKLTKGEVKKGINVINSFSFDISPNNIGFSLIRDFKTLVSVYNEKRRRYEFQGRVLYSSSSMSESGNISKSVICESFLGYLQDSVQPYAVEQNWTPAELLTHLINQHNAQLEEEKQFRIGAVELSDNIYIGIQRETTWECIQKKIIEKVGGELQLRVVEENGKNVMYLDLLKKIGATRATTIELSKNMMSITKESDPSSYITRLIPLGAKIKDEAGNDTEERVDISSVNDGKNYIDDTEAIEKYGLHIAYEYWDDVNTPSILKTKGANFLISNNKILQKHKISLLDLAILGIDIDFIEVGDYYPVKNPLLGINDTLRVITKTVDIVDATRTNVDIGDKLKTLSDLEQEREDLLNGALGNLEIIEKVTNELKGEVADSKDLVNDLNEISTRIQAETKALQDSLGILLSAEYVKETDFGAYKKTIEESLAKLSVTAEGITASVEAKTTELKALNGALQTVVESMALYWKVTAEAVIIGRPDSGREIRMDDDTFAMRENNINVLWFENGGAHVPSLNVQEEINEFGMYKTEVDSEGRVNTTYIGG